MPWIGPVPPRIIPVPCSPPPPPPPGVTTGNIGVTGVGVFTGL